MIDPKLDEALDQVPSGGGNVNVDRTGGGATEIDVVDVDRLGVRVRSVRVKRDRPVDVAREAQRLPDAVRALPDRLEPVEVAPSLGGAKLRTRQDELRGDPRRGREYFEVEVEPQQTTIRRTKITDEGTRAPSDWTMSRDQLDRLIDETTGSGE